VSGAAPIRRPGAAERLTGAFAYTVDLTRPGMLHGRLLRSSHAHARIRALDVSAARTVPGVHAVLTAADVPDVRFGMWIRDEVVLARDVVRHQGEPVAAVAAATPDAAAAALRAIAVEYAPLPVVADGLAALREDAPLVHPGWADYRAHEDLRRRGNVCTHAVLRKGEADRVFREAPVVVSGEYRTHMVHQGYMEPRAAVAEWDADGGLTVWSGTQLPFDIRDDLAEILGIAPGRIRVVAVPSGGAFGGKLYLGVEHFCALLARAAGRPVKMVTTVEEELSAAYPRMPMHLDVATAVSADGIFLARRARAVADAGAYAGATPSIACNQLNLLVGPYRIPHLHMEALAVYTNKANCGAFRAPGAPQAVFALESHVDAIAVRLGMDAVELRRRNLLREGDEGPSRWTVRGVAALETLERAASAIGWSRPAGPNRGRGVACAWWATTGGSSNVRLELDGTGLTLFTGAAEMGTAAVSSAAALAAATLGVDPTTVRIVQADTARTPVDFGSQGSRTAFSVGHAARRAAADLARQLREAVARRAGVPVDSLDVTAGAVRARDGARPPVPLAEAARLVAERGGPAVGRGSYVTPTPEYDPTTLDGSLRAYLLSPSFHTHAVEIEVDPETGEVSVLRYVVAQDVGHALSPDGVRAQIEGGVVQGLGYALSEEIVFRDGLVLNPGLTDYKMPTAMDAPEVELVLVERPGEHGPFGAKGAAEPPVIPAAAAIANALRQAVGVELNETPLTAERVLRALRVRARG
jgi:CO/xanthine dehydrogenase Mo-binding subunit